LMVAAEAIIGASPMKLRARAQTLKIFFIASLLCRGWFVELRPQKFMYHKHLWPQPCIFRKNLTIKYIAFL
jgi:hypothetical protein